MFKNIVDPANPRHRVTECFHSLDAALEEGVSAQRRRVATRFASETITLPSIRHALFDTFTLLDDEERRNQAMVLWVQQILDYWGDPSELCVKACGPAELNPDFETWRAIGRP